MVLTVQMNLMARCFRNLSKKALRVDKSIRRADIRLSMVLHLVVIMRSLLEDHIGVVLPALIKLVRLTCP